MKEDNIYSRTSRENFSLSSIFLSILFDTYSIEVYTNFNVFQTTVTSR